MNKELMDKLNPQQRIEYYVRIKAHTYYDPTPLVTLGIIGSFFLAFLYGRPDYATTFLSFILGYALFIMIVTMIGNIISESKINKEFTQKAIDNIEKKGK